MTRNPYAHPMDEPPAFDVPSRVSGLAVTSLIFSLICCIPGAGLVGTILGGAGLIAIGRSEGRLTGRAVAFLGVVFGVLCTVLWLAVGIGLRQGVVIAEREIFDPAVAMVQAMEKQDWAAARKLLAPAVTEDQIKAFAGQLTSELGGVQGLPQQMDLNKMFGQNGGQTIQFPGNSTPLPLPLEFKNGAAMVFLVTDSPTTVGEVFLHGGTLQGKVIDIVVICNGKEVRLVAKAGKSGNGGGGAGGATGGTGASGR